jgi:transposase-like protein
MGTDWLAVKQQYIHGTMSLVELAREHDLNDSTMRSRAMREQWQEQRDEIQRVATEQATAQAVKQRTHDLLQLNKDDLTVARALKAQITKHLALSQQTGNPLAPRDLRALASAAEAVQRVGRLAVGASTDNRELSGPNQTPIPVTNVVDVEAYKDALRRALDEF